MTPDLADEIAYLTFCNARRVKISGLAIVQYFGSRTAARFELRWQAEQAVERIYREGSGTPNDAEMFGYRDPLGDIPTW